MESITRLINIAIDERNKLREKREECQKELSELPKGRIQRIKRNPNLCEYLFLSYYCDIEKKTKNKNLTKEQVPAIEKQLKERTRLKEELCEISQELKSLEKLLKFTDKLTRNHDVSSVRQKVKEVSADNKQEPSAQAKSVKNKETP